MTSMEPGSEYPSLAGQYSFRVLALLFACLSRRAALAKLPAWLARKEPSWAPDRHALFVADLAARRCPS